MEVLEDQFANLALGRSYSDNTIQAYSGDLKRLLVYLSSRAGEPSRVTGLDLVAFLEDEARNGFKRSTLQRRRVFVIQLAKVLYQNGALEESELAIVQQWESNLWRDSYERDVVVLTEDELTRIYHVLDADASPKGRRNAAMVALMLETGLSVQEVMAIRIADLNESMTKLVVNFSDGAVIYDTNTSSGLLFAYLAQGRPELVQSPQEQILFISQLGGPISRQGVWQALKGLGRAADLKQPLSPRTLRHTAVASMLQAGLSVGEIQKRIGHSNPFSTRALIRKINRFKSGR